MEKTAFEDNPRQRAAKPHTDRAPERKKPRRVWRGFFTSALSRGSTKRYARRDRVADLGSIRLVVCGTLAGRDRLCDVELRPVVVRHLRHVIAANVPHRRRWRGTDVELHIQCGVIEIIRKGGARKSGRYQQNR